MSFKAELDIDIKDFIGGIQQAIDQSKAFASQVASQLGDVEKNIKDFSERSSKQLNDLGDSFNKVGVNLTKFLSTSITGVAAASFALAKNVGDIASELSGLSAVTGASTTAIQEWRHVATIAGTSADTFSDAGERLLRRLRDVGDDSSKVSQALHSIGVATKDSAGNLRSGADIIEDAIMSMADMEDGLEKSNLGVQLFGRGWKRVAPMISLGVDEIERAKKEAQELGLVLSDEDLLNAEKLRKAIAMVTTRFTLLTNKIGAELAPLITQTLVPLIDNTLTPMMSRLASFVGRVSEGFQNLSAPMQKTVIAITGIAAALGPASLAIGALLKTLPLLMTGFATLTGPVGLAVAAIAGAVALIVKNWDSIVAYFTAGPGSKTFDEIKKSVATLVQAFRSAFDGVMKVIRKIMPDIKDFLGIQIKGVVDVVGTVLTTLIDVVSGILKAFASLVNRDFKGVFEAISDIVESVMLGVINIVRSAVSALAKAFAQLFDIIKLEGVADKIRGFAEWVKPAQKTVQKSTEEATGAITEQGKEADKTKVAVEGLGGSLSGAGEDAKEFRLRLNEILSDFGVFSATMAVITAKFDGFRDIAKKAGATLEELKRIDMAEWVGKTIASIERLSFKSIGLDGMSGSINIPVNIDWEGISKKLEKDMPKVKAPLEEFAAEINDTINRGVADSIGGLASAIGEALGSGGDVMSAIGDSLLATLGGVLVNLGKMAIQVGVGIEAVKKALSTLNPFVAIAAGATLVALGSMFRAGAKNLSRGAGGGVGYSSGSYSSSSSNIGPSDFRGAYPDEVVLRAQGEDLVGVIGKVNNRKDRI